MYAIELDGRHVGFGLAGKRLGMSKGKRVIRDVKIGTIFSIEHKATRVRVTERKRSKTSWGAYYNNDKTTVFLLNDEVEVIGESNENQ